MGLFVPDVGNSRLVRYPIGIITLYLASLQRHCNAPS
jgi:hypothetical protein